MESSKVTEAIRGSARGSLILLAGQGASTVVQALGIILIARFLGAVNFGVVSVAYIPVSLAMTLLDVGINSALVKYLSQYRAEDNPRYRRVLIETGALINLLVGASLTAFLYLSSGYVAGAVFNQPELEPLIRFYSFILLGTTLINTVFSILLGYERMTSRSSINVFYSFMKSIAGPILVYFGLGPIGAVLGNVAATFIAGLVGLIVVGAIWRMEPRGDPVFTHLECARLVLSYGYPLFFSHLLIGLTPNINNFLLALFVEYELMGNYQAAVRFGVLITFFTLSVATALFPLFSKLERNAEALKIVLVHSVKYIGLIVFPIIAAIIALSPQIITVLYAEDYQYAGAYIRYFMLSYVVLGFGGAGLVSFLNAIGRNKVVFTESLINFLLTVTLGLALIPRWGVEGLIASITIGPIAGLLYGLYWVKRNLGFTIDMKTAFKSLLAASVACAVTLLFASVAPLSPVLVVVSGGLLFLAVYALLVLVFRVLSHEDLNNLLSVTTGLGPFSPLIRRLLVYVRKKY